MTPPPPIAGATTAGRLRTNPGTRIPRRTSGPAPRPRSGATTGPRRAPAIGTLLRRLPDAPVLDRLLRGRAWIVVVAAALIGIVFMQVSLLKLNAGISQDVAAADAFERQNAQLRADMSGLDGAGRVQDGAANAGLVQPPAGEVTYLDARRADAASAVASLKAPDPQKAATVALAWRQAFANGLVTAGVVRSATPASAASAAQPTTTTTAPAQPQTAAVAQPQAQAQTQTPTPPQSQATTTTTTPTGTSAPPAATGGTVAGAASVPAGSP